MRPTARPGCAIAELPAVTHVCSCNWRHRCRMRFLCPWITPGDAVSAMPFQHCGHGVVASCELPAVHAGSSFVAAEGYPNLPGFRLRNKAASPSAVASVLLKLLWRIGSWAPPILVTSVNDCTWMSSVGTRAHLLWRAIKNEENVGNSDQMRSHSNLCLHGNRVRDSSHPQSDPRFYVAT